MHIEELKQKAEAGSLAAQSMLVFATCTESHSME